jgi:hypothetical protein
MKQSKTKYIHSLFPFLICPSILIPLPMHNHHPHCHQCEQIIASRVSQPPTATTTQTDDPDTTMANRSQVSTLPPLPHEWIITKHNQSSAPSSPPCQRTMTWHNQSSAPSTAAITQTDNCNTTMAKRSQAFTLLPLPCEWIMTKHNQSSAPSPLPRQQTIRIYRASASCRLHHQTSRRYCAVAATTSVATQPWSHFHCLQNKKYIILLTNLFFTTMIMATCSDDGRTMR